MIELRKVIQARLKIIHSRVYYPPAPDAAQFPYIVYNIPTLYDDGEGHQLITLDIDGWDAPKDGDTTVLETLMTAVNAGMNKKTIVTETFSAVFYLETKLVLTEDDPRIKRRKYVYQGRVFERSGAV